MKSTTSNTLSFRYQPVMATKDWYLLAILAIVSSTLWAWVWVEYQKPIVDPAWFADHVAIVNSKTTNPNHPPQF